MVGKEKAPAVPAGASPHQHANGKELARESSVSGVQKTITDALTPDTPGAVEFLQRLRPSGPWLLAAIPPEGGAPVCRSFGPDDLAGLAAWLEQHQGQRNLYYHLNPTAAGLRSKAKKGDITAVEWLHVDIDPRAGEDLQEERSRAFSLLSDSLPKGIPAPTVVVDSGGGYQALWRLDAPVHVDGDEAKAQEVERYTRQLESAFSADHCHNVDRIMRLPGTINVPNDKKRKKGRVPRLAQVVEFNDTAHPLEGFTQAPAVGGAGGAGGGNGKPSGQTTAVAVSGDLPRLDSVDDLDKWAVPDWLKVLIVQGHDPDDPQKYPSRSEAYFACACWLVRSGVPDDVAVAVLTDPDFGISEGILEKPNPIKYAARQVGQAHGAVDVGWNPVNKEGQPVKCLHNTVVALRKLGVECRHDLFRRRNLVGHHELQEFAGEFSDQAEVLLRKFIRQQFGFDPGKEHVKDAVLELCADNRFDPLLDYLDGLPAWDGVARLDRWLHTYLGAEDNAYTRQAGATWLLAAIARAKQPGVKFDHMLVLVGAQGMGKSTALRILAGDDFFKDTNFLGARDAREVLEATAGAWIIECAELAGMRHRDAESLKHEITKQEDTGRPAYTRNVITVRRRFVLAGTTNSKRFLQDDTGNRRFWPVETAQVDLEGLARDRSQLWAEALSRFFSGDYRLYLTSEAKQQAEAAQQERRSADESVLEQLETLLAEGYYNGVPAIATESVYTLLDIPKERRHQHAARVKRAMEVLGWEPTGNSVRWMGKKQRLYIWGGKGPAPEVVSPETQFE